MLERKKKRIIFTVINDLTYDQRMHRICGSLAGAGFEVELIGRILASSVPPDEKAFKQKRLKCFFNTGKLFYLEYNLRLLMYLLFRSCDYISAVDLDTLLPCALVSVIKQKKLFFDAHEYFTEVPEVTGRKLVKKMWEVVAKICMPHVEQAYTVGPALAAVLAKQYNRPFEVIRNVPWAKDAVAAHTKPGHAKIILYQGALNEGRGLEETIRAMHRVDAALWIAGEGDLSDSLRALAEKENLQNKVTFLGYRKPDELRQLTAQAYIGINLLQSKGLSYYYSLANKFFDYMHAGIPCLCVNFPEYAAIHEKYGCTLLCETQTDAIAGALNLLLTDEALYQQLKANCLLAKDDFCWEKEETKLLALYNT